VPGYSPRHEGGWNLKILVTGAGALLGQGIIRTIRSSSLDASIVAIDPSPLSAGLYWANSSHLVPMANDPTYLDKLNEILVSERPDCVIPGTDVELLVLSENRAKIEKEFATHVIVSSPDVIRIADDKWLTAQFLQEQGLGYVPSCLPGDEDKLIAEVGFPLIIKPRVGARSIGFSVIKNMDQLQQAIKSQPGIVIQKHVGSASTEFTAGTLTFDGKCHATIVMRRDLRDGNTYRGFVESYPDLNAAMRLAADRLQAHGPANFQFRLDDGVPRIFEINGRFSGTTPLRSHAGFNEVEMSIRHILEGEPITQPRIEPLVILRHWSETIVKPEDILFPNVQAV
jgi:carbamoyl-phosphate synthase large subunit